MHQNIDRSLPAEREIFAEHAEQQQNHQNPRPIMAMILMEQSQHSNQSQHGLVSILSKRGEFVVMGKKAAPRSMMVWVSGIHKRNYTVLVTCQNSMEQRK